MLTGSVFMSALQSEKRVRNELHFFSSSHFKAMIFWLVRSQAPFTCSVSSVPHIKTGKASLLAVLLFIVGCLTCFSITIHSRERLSPLWKPVGPLLGEKAALPQEEIKCLCSGSQRVLVLGGLREFWRRCSATLWEMSGLFSLKKQILRLKVSFSPSSFLSKQ